MKKEIIISEANDLAVVLENGRATEFFLRSGDQLVGDIIWGQVESVVPGIEAAFVNIGQDKNGFIHVSDLPSAQAPRKNQAPKAPSIKARERLLVQIAKAPTGTKGARLTGRITIPGRFLVLVPHDNRVSISRRITSERERERLRKLTLKLKDPGHGLIVRTEAIGRSDEDLKQDILELIDIWADILHQIQIVRPPALLHRDSDLIHRVLRDAATSDVSKVVLDSRDGAEKARDILSGWMPDLAQHVMLYTGQSILDQYRITQELEAAISPKVWLPSGGYLIIEHTEALTVIDVNSGRMTQTKSLADTVLKVNLEAAAEVARQLRLRDIGGIIVIDFISMDTDADRRKVLQAFQEALKADKSRPQMTNFSEHGLIEVSRRRQGQSLVEQLTTACEACHGSGRLPHSHLLKGAATVSPVLAETSSVVHEIALEPLATEPVRPTRAPRPAAAASADAEFEIEDFELDEEGADEEGANGEDGGRKRRRRRRRGRGRGREAAETMGGTLTSTLPEGLSEADEDRSGFLPPVAVPEEVRAPRGRGRGRVEREAAAIAAPETAFEGPAVEEISLDDLFGGDEPQLEGRDHAPRERGGRSRGRGPDRDRGGRDRDRAPRAERPSAAPAPAASAAGGESRFARRVERRPEGASPLTAPAPAPAVKAAPAPRAVAAPAPVVAPKVEAPKPAPKAKAPAKPKAAPKPLAVPEALETTPVPGVFVLKKKAPAAAAVAEAPAEEKAAKAPAKRAATKKAVPAEAPAPEKAAKAPAKPRKTAAKAEAPAAEAPVAEKVAKAPAKRATAKKAAPADAPAPETAEKAPAKKAAPRKKAAPVEA